MRTLLFITVLSVLASSCHETSANGKTHTAVSDWLTENLKGKVQQIETEIYLVDSATGKAGKLDSKSTEWFDDSGYTVYYSSYTANDSATSVTTYNHDGNRFLTTLQTTKNSKPLSSMQIVMDSAGNYTLATSFDSVGKTDVFYDSIHANDYGQVLSAKGHHPDSTLKMTFVNKYDSVFYVGGESKDSVGKLTYSSTLTLNDKRDVKHMDEKVVTKDSTTETATDYLYDA